MSIIPMKDGSPASLLHLAERLDWNEYHGWAEYARAGAMKVTMLRDALMLATDPPEINISNYSEDDVAALNNWAIQIALAARNALNQPH